MKTQEQKTNVKTYLEHGYNYVVVLTETKVFNVPLYECNFFKTRKKAENFNAERLNFMADVMTTRQAVKKYEFFVNE